MAIAVIASVIPCFLQGLQHRAECPPRVTQLHRLLQLAEALDNDPMRLAWIASEQEAKSELAWPRRLDEDEKDAKAHGATRGVIKTPTQCNLANVLSKPVAGRRFKEELRLLRGARLDCQIEQNDRGDLGHDRGPRLQGLEPVRSESVRREQVWLERVRSDEV